MSSQFIPCHGVILRSSLPFQVNPRQSLSPLLFFSSLSANPIRRDYKRIRRRISSDCEQREGRAEVRRTYRTESVRPTDRLPECRVPSGKLPDSSSDSDAVKPQTFSAPQTTDDRDAALSVSVAAAPHLHFANGASYSRDDSSTSLFEGSCLLLLR